MATTQTLTELPEIQYTGMDYDTVMNKIVEIIEANKNWSSNWTQFYNSEAGTMLIQLFSWLTDNLGIRQDVLLNEMFLSTAQKDSSKIRLLNQIGYTQTSVSAAIVPIKVELNNIATNVVNLSCCRDDESSISSIASNILRFYAPDVNGTSVPYEILSANSDGTINYTTSIKLPTGSAEYYTDTQGRQLTAIQGKTVYKEFTSDTCNGPYFSLDTSNIDLKTLVVYDITDGSNILHKKVSNFLDTDVLNSDVICYIVEKNESGYYQIRYADEELVQYGDEKLEDRLFPAGHTIGVLFRTCKGSVGNVAANYFSTDDTVYDTGNNSISITISNVLAGYNGKDGESLSTAVKNAPLSIVTMDRAVIVSDFDTLLQKNDLVLNSKTYSPDNQPSAFADYFGRKINPQEVFSFIVLNKNFNDCPNEKLNYFPWIELNKEGILNEEYVFGNASMNNVMNSTGIYNNVYIEDDYDEYKKTAYSGSDYDVGTDKGQWYFPHYDYDYYKNDKFSKNYKARLLRNLVLFKTSGILGETIINEKSSLDYAMKVKIHDEKTSSLYIDGIESSVSDENTTLSTDNNIIEEEVSAQYTSTRAADVIDCINYKYLKFVIDDNLVITVDLQKEKMTDDEFQKKYGIGESGMSNYFQASYSNYYLHVSNTPTTTDEEYENNLKANYTTSQVKKKMVSYINSTDYADYRTGIVELIQEAVKKYAEYGLTTFDSSTYEGSSTDNILISVLNNGKKIEQINDTTAIYSYKDSVYVLGGSLASNGEVSYSKIYDTVTNSKTVSNETETTLKTSQDYSYKSALVNGYTAFVDLGLQDKNLTMQDTNLESGGYLYNDYSYSIGSEAGHYSAEDRKCFYTLRINDNIYAFRIDAYTALKAFKVYDSIKENASSTSSSEYFDYFKYIGKGDIFSNISIDTILANNELSEVFATIKKNYPSYFSRENINSSCIAKDQIIKVYGDNVSYSDDSEIDHILFALGSVATTLEYLVSPFNVEAETVYMFIPYANGKSGTWVDIKATTDDTIKANYRLVHGEKTNRKLWINISNSDEYVSDFKNSSLWEDVDGFTESNIETVAEDLKTELTTDDIYDFRNILNGKLRVRYLSKANFTTNSCVNLSSDNYSNDYGEKEWDIRFEYINGGDTLTISSVAETEYSDKTTEEEVVIKIIDDSVNGVAKDLIQELIGYRRQYSVDPISYENKETEVAKVDDDGYLVISSLNKGENSSLYFIQTAERENLELLYYLGLTDGYCNTWNVTSENTYFDRARSNKAYGIKRIELYIADSDNDASKMFTGVPYTTLKDIVEDYDSDEENEISNKLEVGDIIVTSNDLNYVNAKSFYYSYLLTNGDNLKIDKQENFYYSSDEETNELAKPDIVGIEGQAVSVNSDGNYYIDSDKSRFAVKLTKEKVDTNSFYAITEDTYSELKIIENKPVKIITNTFSGLEVGSSETDELYTSFNGAGRNLDSDVYPYATVKACVEYEVPLIMTFDGNSTMMPSNGENFEYSDSIEDYVVLVNAGKVKNASGSSLYSSLISTLKGHTNETFANNYYSYIQKYYNTNNKLVFNGLTNTDDGCIIFYYPDTATCEKLFEQTSVSVLTSDTKGFDLAVKLFYRNLFGTNKTNSEFYKLYPKDKMVASYDGETLNDENIVCYLNDNSDEYFYCPAEGHHLKFIFRDFVDYNNETSKFGDYYITAQALGSDNSFKSGYEFYINKTAQSEFPDCPFYLHFVNDRSYEYKRTSGSYQTEQDVLTEYMKKHKITGTELHFLKPYFKTFDIEATINYNANYDLATIKENVEAAISDKFRIANITDINVGNTIYRSDVFKTIQSVDGVEAVSIKYFGYDYTDQSTYPDQKYALSIESDSESTNGSEFYIISVLADDETNHGFIVSYKKNDATEASI